MRRTVAPALALLAVLAAAILPSALAREPGWHTIKASVALVCREREDFDQIVRIRASGDKVALDKVYATAVYSGSCTTLHRGDEVYVEEVKLFAGVVKIRRRGDANSYWTALDFLD